MGDDYACIPRWLYRLMCEDRARMRGPPQMSREDEIADERRKLAVKPRVLAYPGYEEFPPKSLGINLRDDKNNC